jgi:hypothetical protein
MNEAKEKKVAKNTQILTPEFRVSFPSVFQKKAAAEGQEPKYSIVMLVPKTTDLTAMKQAVVDALTEKWGPDKAKWPKGLRLPFRDGSEKDYEGYENVVFCSASTKNRPGLVDRDVKPIIDPNEFYGGCYARATVAAFAYDKAGNRGVSFGLRNIQKTRDGEPFSGRSKPENDFDSLPVPSEDAVKSDPLDALA